MVRVVWLGVAWDGDGWLIIEATVQTASDCI